MSEFGASAKVSPFPALNCLASASELCHLRHIPSASTPFTHPTVPSVQRFCLALEVMLGSLSSWWKGGSPAAPKVEEKPFDPTDPKQNPLNPKGLKPCCACPETKSARDDCFLKYDPSVSPEKCADVVQKHIACMRGLGFKV